MEIQDKQNNIDNQPITSEKENCKRSVDSTCPLNCGPKMSKTEVDLSHNAATPPLIPTESCTEDSRPSLTLLGHKTEYKKDYAPEVLETFINKHPNHDYWVTFHCPEFTSLCPITGQPDFATIRIDYIPNIKMVESKSLKLYLFSFRNHGAFHEDCVNIILNDLVKLMSPKYIEVTGYFTPRGGISIYPYANWGEKGTKFEKLAEERLLRHSIPFQK